MADCSWGRHQNLIASEQPFLPSLATLAGYETPDERILHGYDRQAASQHIFSTFGLRFLMLRELLGLLRRNHPAQYVASGQHDTAPVDLRWRLTCAKTCAFNQFTAAGRTLPCLPSCRHHGMAFAANPLHAATIRDSSVAENPPHPYTGGMHPPVRLVAIDMDGTLLPTFSRELTPRTARALQAAQQAGITIAIATGRRVAYTTPLLDGLNLRADTPLITSNGAVTRTLGGETLDRVHLPSAVARGICALLRPFGALVFTFDRPGREMVVEDMEQASNRIALWVEANRNSIEVVKSLEDALVDGEDPIQGMVAGSLSKMREAEEALNSSSWAAHCDCIKTEYSARDLSILDLLPPGISKGWALERLAARLGVDKKETMAIGDNWNDLDMLEWAGQAIVMGNAARELRTMAKTRGWKQAPPNDQDGVAQILEAAVARRNGV
jgi:hypothetical protein